MTERIKEIAAYFSLSPAGFADAIGISRPVVSHIFNGRNKPSLEVVQKIGMAFPDLSSDWLLYGSGEMLKKLAPPITEVPFNGSKITSPENLDVKEKVPFLEGGPKEEKLTNTGKAKPESILLIFDDGTFKMLLPG